MEIWEFGSWVTVTPYFFPRPKERALLVKTKHDFGEKSKAEVVGKNAFAQLLPLDKQPRPSKRFRGRVMI